MAAAAAGTGISPEAHLRGVRSPLAPRSLPALGCDSPRLLVADRNCIGVI